MLGHVALDQEEDAALRESRTRAPRILLAENNPTSQLVVKQVLRELEANISAIAMTGEHSDAAEQAPVVDASILDEFIEEVGEESTRKIVTTFLSETERRLGALRDMTCDDREAIELESHTLIGSSGIFGMMRLSALSRRLQGRAATIMPDEYRLAVAQMTEIYAASCRELNDYLQKLVEEPKPGEIGLGAAGDLSHPVPAV